MSLVVGPIAIDFVPSTASDLSTAQWHKTYRPGLSVNLCHRQSQHTFGIPRTLPPFQPLSGLASEPCRVAFEFVPSTVSDLSVAQNVSVNLGHRVDCRTKNTILQPTHQGCSLGLERLGLETVSRRFLERLVSSRS